MFEVNDKVMFKVDYSVINSPSEMIVKSVEIPLGEKVTVFYFDKNETYNEIELKSEMLEKRP